MNGFVFNSVPLNGAKKYPTMYNEIYSDGIGLSDAYGRVLEIDRVYTESLDISDQISRNLNISRTYTETITLTDSLVNSVLSILRGVKAKISSISFSGKIKTESMSGKVKGEQIIGKIIDD